MNVRAGPDLRLRMLANRASSVCRVFHHCLVDDYHQILLHIGALNYQKIHLVWCAINPDRFIMIFHAFQHSVIENIAI